MKQFDTTWRIKASEDTRSWHSSVFVTIRKQEYPLHTESHRHRQPPRHSVEHDPPTQARTRDQTPSGLLLFGPPGCGAPQDSLETILEGLITEFKISRQDLAMVYLINGKPYVVR